MRDEHLRQPGYFDAKKFPRIRLVSDKISASSRKGTFLFEGKLTLKDRTKAIAFPFTAEASSGGGYTFKGTFTINRKDFGIVGASTISDNLEVALDVIAK